MNRYRGDETAELFLSGKLDEGQNSDIEGDLEWELELVVPHKK